MFGIIFGTACLFGLVGLARGHRHHHHHAYGGYGRGCHPHARRHHHRGRERRHSGISRAMGEAIKRGLRIDEEQEDLVDHALKDARAAMSDLKQVFTESREDLAKAFSDETVDDAALTALFAAQDEAWAKARREVVSSLKQIHAVLDEDQRATGVAWLATGPTWRK